jgi:hypothetical protein
VVILAALYYIHCTFSAYSTALEKVLEKVKILRLRLLT